MTYCPYCSGDAFAAINYVDAPFKMCRECGVVFKTLSEENHAHMAASTYSMKSWGRDKQHSIEAHGPIIGQTLKHVSAQQAFSPGDTYLDIGAGVGVLEHVFFEMLGTKDVRITPLEPVPAIAQFLQQEYPSLNVVNADLEDFPKRSSEKFDVVFCLGVDYLFKDLDASLDIISKIGRKRWIFSRGVFLDMPSYFGGTRIKAFRDLVQPNPLISVFMYADQYGEMLSRCFEINTQDYLEFSYDVPDSVMSRFFVADCSVAPKRDPKPIRDPGRAIARLAELGVKVEL